MEDTQIEILKEILKQNEDEYDVQLKTFLNMWESGVYNIFGIPVKFMVNNNG